MSFYWVFTSFFLSFFLRFKGELCHFCQSIYLYTHCLNVFIYLAVIHFICIIGLFTSDYINVLSGLPVTSLMSSLAGSETHF